MPVLWANSVVINIVLCDYSGQGCKEMKVSIYMCVFACAYVCARMCVCVRVRVCGVVCVCTGAVETTKGCWILWREMVHVVTSCLACML